MLNEEALKVNRLRVLDKYFPKLTLSFMVNFAHQFKGSQILKLAFDSFISQVLCVKHSVIIDADRYNFDIVL